MGDRQGAGCKQVHCADEISPRLRLDMAIQSFHVFWLLVTALLVAAGSR